MKRKNIVVGMRVEVKKSCEFTAASGRYATVINLPCDGLAKFAVCLVDGLDEKQVLDINTIKISDEKPVAGDRIVVVKTGQEKFFRAGSGGVVQGNVGDGFFVKFDSGDYTECHDGVWGVSSESSRIAIIRDVK